MWLQFIIKWDIPLLSLSLRVLVSIKGCVSEFKLQLVLNVITHSWTTYLLVSNLRLRFSSLGEGQVLPTCNVRENPSTIRFSDESILENDSLMAVKNGLVWKWVYFQATPLQEIDSWTHGLRDIPAARNIGNHPLRIRERENKKTRAFRHTDLLQKKGKTNC